MFYNQTYTGKFLFLIYDLENKFNDLKDPIIWTDTF